MCDRVTPKITESSVLKFLFWCRLLTSMSDCLFYWLEEFIKLHCSCIIKAHDLGSDRRNTGQSLSIFCSF
jgi:hypothetical protein